MHTLQALYLSASVIAGVALAAALRGRANSPDRARVQLALSLGLLAFALLCVGVVSHTFVRHIVQIVPPVLVLILVGRHSPYGTLAAVPILTFWLAIMANIWMFLLGIARIFSGTFTFTEIVLTVIIAITCAWGLAMAFRAGSLVAMGRRIAIATAFGLLQLAALVLSFLPIFR